MSEEEEGHYYDPGEEAEKQGLLLFVPAVPVYITADQVRDRLVSLDGRFANVAWQTASTSSLTFHQILEDQRRWSAAASMIVLCLLTTHAWTDEELLMVASIHSRWRNLVLLVSHRRGSLDQLQQWHRRTRSIPPPAILLAGDGHMRFATANNVPECIRQWAAITLPAMRRAYEAGDVYFNGLSEEDYHLLDKAGKHDVIPVRFAIPSRGLSIESAKVIKIFQSETKPKQLLCTVAHPPDASPAAAMQFIWKRGDNIYNDQVCLGMMRVFNEVWRTLGTTLSWTDMNGRVVSEPIRCRTYDVFPMEGLPGLKTALIEYVRGRSIMSMWDRNVLGFDHRTVWNEYGSHDDPTGRSFTKRLATAIGAFIAGYVLAIGDGHQDNMMLDAEGNFFRIDFQYWGGETPIIDAGEFPLPWGFGTMLEKAGMWPAFVEASWQALVALAAFEAPLLSLLADKAVFNPQRQITIWNVVKRKFALARDKEAFVACMEKGKYRALPKHITHMAGQYWERRQRKQQLKKLQGNDPRA